jgi:hypothetical protein
LDHYNQFIAGDHHRRSGEKKAIWHPSGEGEDWQLLFSAGFRAANSDRYSGRFLGAAPSRKRFDIKDHYGRVNLARQ